MAARSVTPRSRGGAVARLTHKVGPLPVWGWAAAILAAYFLFSRMRPPAATTTSDSAAATAGGSDSQAQVPASGQGGATDNVNGMLVDALGANRAAIDALTTQVLTAVAHPPDYGDAPPAGSGESDSPPSTSPTPTPPTQPTPTTPPVTTPTGTQTQTQTDAGALHWGGLTFTSKTAFDNWARSHGTTTAKELRTHPQARAIYGTLR